MTAPRLPVPPVLRGVSVTLRPTNPGDDAHRAAARQLFSPAEMSRHRDGPARWDDTVADELFAQRPGDVVRLFVVTGDGAVVGLAQLYLGAEAGPAGGGIDLVLAPWARRRGIGTQVVAVLVRYACQELGWARLVVDPEVTNTDAVCFWASTGFVAESVVREPGRPAYQLMAWPVGRPWAPPSSPLR